MTLVETAYAKLNLALHVRQRRSDGYHDIETLFAFADFGDTIRVAPAESLHLSVSGPFANELGNGGDNLVLRAARAIAEHGDVEPGARIELEKNLPVASGIGGGSADAAATLRLLNRLWALELPDTTLAAIGSGIGADVPACVYSSLSRGEGVGERLAFLESPLHGVPVVLVNPLQPVSTAAVFAAWDGIDRGRLGNDISIAALGSMRNDLEPAAIGLCPVIGDVLAELRDAGGQLVRMSGSGATCFALMASLADAKAAAAAIAARKSWWVRHGLLR